MVIVVGIIIDVVFGIAIAVFVVIIVSCKGPTLNPAVRIIIVVVINEAKGPIIMERRIMVVAIGIFGIVIVVVFVVFGIVIVVVVIVNCECCILSGLLRILSSSNNNNSFFFLLFSLSIYLSKELRETPFF